MFDVFVAMSLNFKIFDNNFPSIFNYFSDEYILELRKKIRNEYKTIIVGANTIKIDNPNLLNSKKNNIRLVIDKYADINLNSNIFQNEPKLTYVLLLKNNKDYIKKLRKKGVNVILFEETDEIKIINKIKELCKGKVLIEGGAKTIEMFLKHDMINLLKIVQFPFLMPTNTLSMLSEFNFYKKLNVVNYKLINNKYIYEVFNLESEKENERLFKQSSKN